MQQESFYLHSLSAELNEGEVLNVILIVLENLSHHLHVDMLKPRDKSFCS